MIEVPGDPVLDLSSHSTLALEAMLEKPPTGLRGLVEAARCATPAKTRREFGR